jgi:hypothetical protein
MWWLADHSTAASAQNPSRDTPVPIAWWMPARIAASMITTGLLFAIGMHSKRKSVTAGSKEQADSLGVPAVTVQPSGYLATGPEKQDPQINRLILDLKPADLTALYKLHTSAQADALAKIYIGKWTRVSGPLADVQNFESFMQITFEDSQRIYGVSYLYMYFGKPWFDAGRSALADRTPPAGVSQEGGCEPEPARAVNFSASDHATSEA